jgi:uncharacterized membrane protein (DUF4010 family)
VNDFAILVPPADGLVAGIRLGVAALLGLAVGIERQWSGHATGPAARFAGMRTFFLLGILGGASGLFASAGQVVLGTAVLLAAASLAVVAFVVALRRPHAEMDATTEVAALAVLALGAFAGGGQLVIAAGAIAMIVFALGEKDRLHTLVERVEEAELHAAARFAVMALVVLPLLPAQPVSWLGDLSPRQLWLLIVVFSGVNFVGYLAQRAVGADRGYGIAGLFGGLVSSTAVTLQFARRSREQPEHAAALARGTVAASAIGALRVLAIVAAIAPAVARESALYLIPPAVIGGAYVVVGLMRGRSGDGTPTESRSPLNVISSVKLALFLTAALMLVEWLGSTSNDRGILLSAAALGLTDNDALAVSMARYGVGDRRELAAQAIAVGLVSNAVFKAAAAVVLGNAAFRLRTVAGFGAMVAAIVAVALMR